MDEHVDSLYFQTKVKKVKENMWRKLRIYNILSVRMYVKFS